MTYLQFALITIAFLYLVAKVIIWIKGYYRLVNQDKA